MKDWISQFTALMLMLLLTACTPVTPLSEGGFDSPDPAARLYAIQRAGQTRDHLAVKALIERLDSDDPAERLLSIEALGRITGTRLDYNPYDTAQQRSATIAHWVDFADSPEFVKGQSQ